MKIILQILSYINAGMHILDMFRTDSAVRVALALADHSMCMCFRVPGYFTEDGVLCEACSTCSDNEYAVSPCSSSANVVCETCFNVKPAHSEYIANCAWSCKTSKNLNEPGSCNPGGDRV